MDDESSKRAEQQRPTTVELCYGQRRRQRRVVLRSVATGRALWTSVVTDGPAALHAAARALAVCEARRWAIARIEPFPWANELARASANDGAAPVERATRGASRAR
jgi:hypothetical protein